MSGSEQGPEAPLLPIIGRREYVSFPAWNLNRVRAKVDSGAFSSSLDVASYEIVEGDNGMVLRMVIALSRRHRERILCAEEAIVGMTKVRSSNGQQQSRPVIEPTMGLGPVSRRIRLTVSDRSSMRCRMLLGRQAIAGVFLVDVSRKYLLSGGSRQ